MAHRLEFDFQHRILLIIHEGSVRGREIEKLGDQLKPQLGALNPSAAISDFSGATIVETSSDMVRHLAMKDAASCLRALRRFIVAPREYQFGLARMYEISAYPPFVDLRVVRSKEEALATLGVQNPEFEELGVEPFSPSKT
jgi:hypothetical protein